MLRVIGGDLRGRSIKAPQGLNTRPTSSKVREALFDIIGGNVVGSNFLDLYAGSGAVGIEALSRGASFSLFVEKHFETSRILDENLRALDLLQRSCVMRMPVEKALKKIAERPKAFRFVFCDPPYGEASLTEILSWLSGSVLLEEGAVMVIEHSSRARPPLPDNCEKIKSYVYGDSSLLLLKRKDP